MVSKYLFLLGLVATLLCGAPLALAQGQPGGPPVVPPNGAPQAQPPPGGLRPDGSPNRGPQQPPANLPADVLNAPYNGPSPRAPAGIPVPRNQDEARQIQEQYRPQMQQALDASRAATEARHRLTERVRRGDLAPPTGAEAAGGHGYSPTRQGPVPPRRSETPVDRAMRLLGLGSVATPPEAQPDAAPDADPSLQSVANACAVYSIGWVETFGWDDWLGAQALNTCNQGISNGTLALYRIDHLNTNMHAYKCSWYFKAFNLCLTPQYIASYYPYCDLYGAHAYQWCGPEYWEPEFYGAGYFIRSWGSVTTIEGLFGYSSDDSENISYHCDVYHWTAACSP